MNTGERQTNIWDNDQHELENKQTTMNIERKQMMMNEGKTIRIFFSSINL